MKNNKKEIFIWTLVLLMIIITTIATILLPDSVPLHYNLSGEIDRWGSKYENFIIVIVLSSTVVFLQCYSKRLKKVAKSKDDYKRAMDAKKNSNVIDYVNIILSLIFNIMNAYILYMEFYHTNSISTSIKVDMFKMLIIILGIMFIAIGNIIPKCKMNSFIGVRTPWSMKNDIAWESSQRYGGIALVISGVISIVGACFLKETHAVIFMIAILIISTIISIYLSYVAYKKSLELTK